MTTTPTLAQRIAFDIVGAAEFYPAVREARSFSALHDAYDVNESIIAACPLHYGDWFNIADHLNDEHVMAECNAATDEIDKILALAGYPGLVMFVVGKFETRTVRIEVPAEFFAEVVVDVSVPHNPRALQISRFVVSPLESHAGYIGGPGAQVADDSPDGAGKAAIGYWEACNDGTWPLDIIAWEE